MRYRGIEPRLVTIPFIGSETIIPPEYLMILERRLWKLGLHTAFLYYVTPESRLILLRK